jgi:hypothetical protein
MGHAKSNLSECCLFVRNMNDPWSDQSGDNMDHGGSNGGPQRLNTEVGEGVRMKSLMKGMGN